MKKIYSFLLTCCTILLVAKSSKAQVTVLKSTTSLCRDIAMPVYYTAYGCDGSVQWLNYLQQPIGTSNVSSDIPSFKGSNTYYVKCGNNTPQVFLIDKTKTVRSTVPSISVNKSSIDNGESVVLSATGCTGTVTWMSGEYVLSNSTNYTVTPSTSTTYFALCTESGKCVSPASEQIITVNVNNQSLPAPVINTQTLGNLVVGSSNTLGAFNCYYTVEWFKNGTSIGTGNTIAVTPSTCDNFTAKCKNGDIVSPASHSLVAGSGSTPSISSQPQAATVCEGGSTTFSVTASNTNAYQWKKNNENIPGQTSATLSLSNISMVDAGAYSVQLTGTCGNITSNSVNLTVRSTPTLLASATNVSCLGGANGSATVNVTGGTAPYSYLWNNGTNTATASGLSAGEYGVRVTDANGCFKNTSVVVNQPSSAFSLTISGVSIKCFGESTGSATVIGSGGNEPYTYSWNNGATTNSISNLAATTYSVTVTDANGCVKIASINLTQPSQIILTTSSTSVKCNGGNDGSASVTPAGGIAPYTYSWSNGATTSSISSLTAGTYTVTVTDANNCSKTTNITVNEPTSLSLSTSKSNVRCKNGNDGTVTVIASGGVAPYTYLWNTGATTATTEGLIAGTYTVTVIDANACSKMATVVVSEPATLFTISTNPQNVKCNGGSDGSATVSPTGGDAPYTYLWSTGATTASIEGLRIGTYAITATDANGCVRTSSVNIVEPPLLSLAISGTNVKCKGGNDGIAIVVADGGTAPYSYKWNTGATTASSNSLIAGNYSVTVTDANGCSKVASVTITEPLELILSASSENVKCKDGSDGSATVSVTGGTAPYSYLWSNGVTSARAEGLKVGTYSVVVKDANGCSKETSVTITEPTKLTFTFSTKDVLCNTGTDGVITAVAQGGVAPYSLVYNGNVVASLTVNTLKAGSYSVSVRDNNNCLATVQTTTIAEPKAIEVSITNEVMPRGFQTKDGKLVTKIIGGTTTSSQKYTLSWLFEGSTTITDIQEIVTGGVTSTLSKIQGGNYSLTVTDDNFALSPTNAGCKKVFTYFIKQPEKIVITTQIDKGASCAGKSDGKVSASVKGGVIFTAGNPYQYVWQRQQNQSWVNMNVNSASLPFIEAGTYRITVIDANDITDSAQVELKLTPSITSRIITQKAPSCSSSNDGAIQIQAIGAVEPVSVSWSKSLTGASIANLTQGTYFGVIKDNAGCYGEVSVTLTAKENLAAKLVSQKDLICADKCDASLELAVTGNTSPYTVQWSNGQTGLKANALCAGNYSATVKTTSGCTATLNNLKIESAKVYQINVSDNLTLCSGSNTEIDASKGTSGVAYAWTYPDGSKSSSPIGIIKSAGNYKVEVTNSTGCKATDDFSVTLVNGITGLNFTVASTGQVGESMYAVNLSPISLNTTWSVTGSASILQQNQSLLVVNPTAVGNVKIELSASNSACKASVVKNIAISAVKTNSEPNVVKTNNLPVITNEESIVVYPNPNNGNFTIRLIPEEEGVANVSVYDASFSQVAFNQNLILKSQIDIPVSISNIGGNSVWYVVVKTGTYRLVKRVIVGAD